MIEDYHRRLIETLGVPAESTVEAAADLVETITRLSTGTNLVVLGAPSHRFHLGDRPGQPGHRRGGGLPRPARPYAGAREPVRPSQAR